MIMRSPAFLVLVTGLGSVFRWRIGSRNRRDDLLHPAESAAQVNPAYLAAERKDIANKKKLNIKATEVSEGRGTESGNQNVSGTASNTGTIPRKQSKMHSKASTRRQYKNTERMEIAAKSKKNRSLPTLVPTHLST